jgi:hypothetical protein
MKHINFDSSNMQDSGVKYLRISPNQVHTTDLTFTPYDEKEKP